MQNILAADMGRNTVSMLSNALAALLDDIEKLAGGNAFGCGFDSKEHPLHCSVSQARTALKIGYAYQAIPILKPGDCFTLRTNEEDLDAEGQERVTSAGSVWVVQEIQPECDPLMQYAVHCELTGGAIHITHAELAECGYRPVAEAEPDASAPVQPDKLDLERQSVEKTYYVHLYATVRVPYKVTANSMQGAIQKAEAVSNLHHEFRSGEYAEEVTGVLVDELDDSGEVSDYSSFGLRNGEWREDVPDVMDKTLLLEEAQKLLATIDSWGGTVHENHLVGLRAALQAGRRSEI